jgi:hypothetical protein
MKIDRVLKIARKCIATAIKLGKFYLSPDVFEFIPDLVKLIFSEKIVPRFSAKLHNINISGPYIQNNISIMRVDGGWRLMVRKRNVIVGPRGRLLPEGRRESFDSQNWVLDCDDDFEISNIKQIDDSLLRRMSPPARHGLEDPRVFEWRGGLWAVWNAGGIEPMTVPNRPMSLYNTMVLGRIHDGKIVEAHYIASPYGHKREKNWMPFVKNDELYFVYKIEDMEIYKYHQNSIEMVHKLSRSLKRFVGYLGSSQLVPWGDDLLCIIHRRLRHIHTGTADLLAHGSYFHIFMVISQDFTIKSYSKDFCFERNGAEYCCGLAVDGQTVAVSYGVRNRLSRVAVFERQQITALLTETI